MQQGVRRAGSGGWSPKSRARKARSWCATEAALKQQKITRSNCGASRSQATTVATAMPAARSEETRKRPSISPGGDGGLLMRLGEGERVGVAVGKQLRLMHAAVPHRSHGVNDVFRGQAIAARDPRLARRTPADRAALLEQLRTRRAMDRAVDAAAAQQRAVGGIDDGIDRRAW
jgi:hypothetical protein